MTRSRYFVPVTFFLVAWTLTTHGKYSVTGDEPHYLIVSQSLLSDGDLDLRNNHAEHQEVRFGAATLEPGPHAQVDRGGRLMPVHDIGVPVLLLPVYAIAVTVADWPPEGLLLRFRMSRGLFAYSIVSLFLIAVAALAAAITRAALQDQGLSDGPASVVVLTLWLAPPVLSNAFVVFPEVFALLITASAVRLSARTGPISARAFVLGALAMGTLPWLHRKYAPYALLLFAVVVWKQRAGLRRLSPRAWCLAGAGLSIPSAALAGWTWYHWHSLSGPLAQDGPPFSWTALKAGWLGLLVDRENGLVPWAPSYLLLPLGWWLTWPRSLLWLLPVAAVFLLSAAHHQWWAGFSPAGRFLAPLVPIFASIIGSVVQHDRYRPAFLLLAFPQLLISAYVWQHPRSLWPLGDGTNRALSALLSWVHIPDRFVPSIRADHDYRGGLIAIGIIILVNVAVWLAGSAARTPRSVARSP
jgi:hypothetical protein